MNATSTSRSGYGWRTETKSPRRRLGRMKQSARSTPRAYRCDVSPGATRRSPRRSGKPFRGLPDCSLRLARRRSSGNREGRSRIGIRKARKNGAANVSGRAVTVKAAKKIVARADLLGGYFLPLSRLLPLREQAGTRGKSSRQFPPKAGEDREVAGRSSIRASRISRSRWVSPSRC